MDKTLTRIGFRGDQKLAVKVFQETYRRGEWNKSPLKIDGSLGPKTKLAIEHCLDHDGYVTRHFSYKEYQCRCGGRYSSCRGILVTRDLTRLAEVIRRAYYPKGLSFESTYRCPGHNAAIPGSASQSQHLFGTAIDIPPVIPRNAKLPAYVGGVGWNLRSGKISHLDTRKGPRAVWTYNR